MGKASLACGVITAALLAVAVYCFLNGYVGEYMSPDVALAMMVGLFGLTAANITYYCCCEKKEGEPPKTG